MPSPLASYLLVPLAATLAAAAVPLVVLHVVLGHAMRARGLPGWRPRDTLLVSPLLAVGLLVAFGASVHGVARFALDVERGHPGGLHLAGSALAALGGFVVAAFGLRAVGKLF